MSTLFVTFQIAEGSRGLRPEEAAIAAAVTFSGYMVSRGVAEGLIDSNRGPKKADMGQ
jgi:hypothetical protein